MPDSLRGASGPQSLAHGLGPCTWGFGAFCFATHEGRKCSRVPGQQDPGSPESQTYGPGEPGAISLTTLECPQRS